MLKDEVSVSVIFVNYDLKKNAEISKSDCKLRCPGCVCKYKCKDGIRKKIKCIDCEKIRKYCTSCRGKTLCGLLKTGIVGKI